jgi:asparagine synthase (glutamine-hydrolysing)
MVYDARVCGLAGIMDPRMAPDERRSRVALMTRAMIHRGPDDEGIYSDDHVTLGFRRLAVIDLETGNQPIRLEGDRAVLVLNGEIYNFRDLRRELESRYRFRTKGDVEVALRLYAEEGIGAVGRLRGMFAMALWDRVKRTLFLARDRFGIKPLFVARTGGGWAFASEMTALLAGGFPERRSLDLAQLRHYLAYKHLTPGGSLLEGVRSLAPASVIESSAGEFREYRYWDPPSVADGIPTKNEAVSRLDELLRDAVRRQLVADVPVGLFLSGGLDSSTLTSLVGRADPSCLRTFSVGFEGAGAASELPWAAEVARKVGSEHHEILMDPSRIAADLDRIVAHLDGPLGDATVIPTWYMSRLARERVTVALSGEGADEVFGGYPRQRFDTVLDRVGNAAATVIPAALRVLGGKASARLKQRLRMPPSLERQLHWGRVFSEDEIDALAGSDLPGEDAITALHREQSERWSRTREQDRWNARLEADRELFLPGDLLPKVDRMSMAHSLEVRVPYLDEDLVDFMLQLPGRWKLGPLRGKLLLKKLAARHLPASIVHRRKQGFDVPIGGWLRGALRERLLDTLSAEAVGRRGLFRPQRVEAWIREHLNGEADHGERLWLLMALEGWQSGVLDRATGPRA